MNGYRGGGEVQAVLFDKNHYTTGQARRWLEKNGYSPMKRAHATYRFYRYRIKDPSLYSKFLTRDAKGTNKTIKYIIGF